MAHIHSTNSSSVTPAGQGPGIVNGPAAAKTVSAEQVDKLKQEARACVNELFAYVPIQKAAAAAEAKLAQLVETEKGLNLSKVARVAEFTARVVKLLKLEGEGTALDDGKVGELKLLVSAKVKEHLFFRHLFYGLLGTGSAGIAKALASVTDDDDYTHEQLAGHLSKAVNTQVTGKANGRYSGIAYAFTATNRPEVIDNLAKAASLPAPKEDETFLNGVYEVLLGLNAAHVGTALQKRITSLESNVNSLARMAELLRLKMTPEIQQELLPYVTGSLSRTAALLEGKQPSAFDGWSYFWRSFNPGKFKATEIPFDWRVVHAVRGAAALALATVEPELARKVLKQSFGKPGPNTSYLQKLAAAAEAVINTSAQPK